MWVFDKGALSAGPIARIDATALGSPYTLHASWIDETDLPTTPVPDHERFGTGPDEFGHVPADERRIRDFLGEVFGWPHPPLSG